MFRDPNQPGTNKWVHVSSVTGPLTMYYCGRALYDLAKEIPIDVANSRFVDAGVKGVMAAAGVFMLGSVTYLTKESVKESAKHIKYYLKQRF